MNVVAPTLALNEENIQNGKEINAFAAGLFDRNRVSAAIFPKFDKTLTAF